MRRLFNRRNREVRTHAVIPIGDSTKRGSYISKVVSKKYYDYYNIKHRVAVCKMDAIAKRLTYVWAKVATAKTFKFYSSHEVDAVQVMQEQRAQWIQYGCREIFRKCITPMVRDGYVLLELMKKDEGLDYEVYGEFESAPKLWIRDAENKILEYRIQYTPQPRGYGSTMTMINISSPGADNLKAVNKSKTPAEVIHMEYGEPNLGCGIPLIEGAWDSIIKLVGVSHQEMMDRRTIPTLHLTEDDYDAEHKVAKDLLSMVANSDQDTARIWYHKESANRGEFLDFPKFAYESPTNNPNYNQRFEKIGISTGDFGNVAAEWTRLTTVTGHTINYFMGNRAGAVVGSETDKIADDEQETIDFGQVEIIIRKILGWLDSKGLITLPAEPFVIKFWKDWERIENAIKEKKDLDEEKKPETDTSDATEESTEEFESEDNEPEKENSLDNSELIKVPILDYPIINKLDTEGKIKKLGLANNWSMGTTTATKIKTMMNSLKEKAMRHQLRFNTMTAEAFGNSIHEHHALLYNVGDGVIVEEYICPEAWKKNVGKTVPLGVYHNLDEWYMPELPDWQIVGNAEIFGWDEEDGSDFVKFSYDYDKIDAIFERINYYDWLTPALQDTGTSDISTAYYCDIEYRWSEETKKFYRVQVNIDLISISFVPRGNCPGEVCSIKVIANNMDAMQLYIKECIAEGEEREECMALAYKKFKAKS